MALQINTTIEVYGTQLEFQNSYHQIDMLNGNKDGLSFIVCIYDSQQKTNLISQKTFSFVPSVAPDSLNFIAQGYNYLKTLPEYENAEDILENV